ncbi:MAG: AMP-binding protein [Actinomycetota bacterium]|nr:AMP-binding protein [Actinomycetota bacterium]
MEPNAIARRLTLPLTAVGRGVTTLDTLRRAGLLDPRAALAGAEAFVRWRASAAAAVSAAARRHPGRDAFVDDDGRLTFAELDEVSTNVAGALRDRGVDETARVGILCRNHRGLVVTLLAASKLGADVVLLNTELAAGPLAEIVEREEIDLLAHDADLVDATGSVAASVTRIVADRPTGPDDGTDVLSVPDLCAVSHGELPRPARDGALVLLTSGTTGVPKGARRGRPPADPLAVAGLLELLPYRAGDVIVVAPPLFHALGMSQCQMAPLMGSTLVVHRRFDAEATLRTLAAERATVLAAVPVMLRRLLAVDPAVRDSLDLSALRMVVCSGSALPPTLAEAWLDTFGENLHNLYGSTEVAQAAIATPSDLRAAPGTVGRAPHGTRIRVLGPDDEPVPAGVSGRVFVGSGFAFEGYTGGTTRAVIDGLMSTGDVGHLDDDGRLFIDGREDDMIVSGGENLYPREVELLLEGLDGVAEVVVVGVPDEEYGERLRAVVVRVEGADLDEDTVRDHARANLGRFKVPRDVVFIDDLPRNPAGKVLRNELRS